MATESEQQMELMIAKNKATASTSQTTETAQQNAVVEEAQNIIDTQVDQKLPEALPTEQVVTEITETKPSKRKPWEVPTSTDDWAEKLKTFGIDEFVPEKVYSKIEELKNQPIAKDERLEDPAYKAIEKLRAANRPLADLAKLLDDTDYSKIPSDQLYKTQLTESGVVGEELDTLMDKFNELTDYEKRQSVQPFIEKRTNERNSFISEIDGYTKNMVVQYEDTQRKNLQSIDTILDACVGEKLIDSVEYAMSAEDIADVKQYIRTASFQNPDGSFNAHQFVADHLKARLFDKMYSAGISAVKHEVRKEQFDAAHLPSANPGFNTPPAPDKAAQNKAAQEEARKHNFD